MNTQYLEKSLKTLEKSYEFLKKEKDESSIEYEIYRNSLVKAFEMTIEQSLKLLKKKLLPYLATKKELDRLSFKEVFRTAHQHDLLDERSVERWFLYRDNYNSTAYDYGESFANDSLALIDTFISDVKTLIEMLDT